MAVTPADAPLLATKLFVPSPRQNRVSRARLRTRLDAARGGTVTLAAAPAGSGKSTLLADWALTTERRVAWLSLDSADDEPRRFINYVIAALKSAGVLSPTDAGVAASTANPEALDAVLTELLNAIAQRQAPAVLVLDDYHVIESESVHRIVQSMIDHLPPNLHLVLASRVDPPLPLSRLRARDMLLEIRASDLRFTEDEAELFLNDAMGLSLTRDQIAELDKRTEGWAVGLQMAAISLRGRSGTTDFISSFSGSNRYVLDYLTDEVLQRVPAEVRSFLLDTSILSRLSAPLCDAVTGRRDSERMLEQLDAGNLFVIALDDVRYWYRYHHLFGSLLQHELERSASAEHIAELHRRASAWYASNRMPDPALNHAVAAHDDDRAVSIVSANTMTHIVAGDGGTIIRWIAQLPRERVDRDFDLLLIHALALTAEYRLEEASRELDRAESAMPAEGRDRYEGAALTLRGMLVRMLGSRDQARGLLDRATTLLDPNDCWYSMALFRIGMVEMMETNLRAAERYFRQAAANRDQDDGLLPAVLGNCYGAWTALCNGRPDEAAVLATEANNWMDDWAAKHGTGRPMASLSYGVLADVHRLWNDLDRAREYARIALDFGRTGFYIGYIETSRVMAQIAEAQGDWDAAIAAITEMGCAVRCAGNHEFAFVVAALESRIRWRRAEAMGNREELEAVARWCEEKGFLDVEKWRENLHPGLFSDASLMVAVRVLMYRKRYDQATRLIDALFNEAVERERVNAQIPLLVLRSLVEAATDRPDAAVDTMQRALEIAAKPRFVRPLLDEGAAPLPLIERAATRIADRDFVTRVLSAFDVPLKPQPQSPLAEPLSDRELEVLQLIAGGASNQDAARKLFVAPSTVKKHLENIYAKLGVGGRTQAVARARELRIL